MKAIFLTLILFSLSAQGSFPNNFQWCVATAGHQIEGDNVNSDWWHWEQTPGHIRNNEISGKASYHIERMEEDIKLMKNIHVKTYRFSIEWSRIEPQQGQFNQEAIEHYGKEIKLLKENGITPFVTLHHFVQPQWFTEMGGWDRDDSPEIFMNYVRKVISELGHEVYLWTTFNEPTVLLLGGFITGVAPPGKVSWNFWNPMVNVLKSHAKAYHYIHEQNPKAMVGLAHHIRPLIAKDWFENLFVPGIDYLLNWNIPLAVKTGELKGIVPKKFLGITYPKMETHIFKELKNTQDFLGINYYTRELIDYRWLSFQLRRDPLTEHASDLNWGIDPEGFKEVLTESHNLFPELPFYITENGLADNKDQYRADYVISHLEVLEDIMQELPHPVLGYCYWSLMDNFEWIEGFEPRFGLFEVDYANKGERKARPSLDVIKEIFRTNRLPED